MPLTRPRHMACSNAHKATFTDQWYMTGIWQVYVYHMSASASATRFLARRVSQALFAASPRHLLLIFSVLATERPATRGWGLPKFQSQVLTSYTWLPLRYPWPGPSAQPNSKSRPCRVLVWNGGGGVAIKEAWKEWNPAKEVLNLANVERRNGWWLVKLSDSVRLDGASESQAKVLKGAEKHQVELKLNR